MIGTLRREVFDRLLIGNEHHLRRALTEYLLHLQHSQAAPFPWPARTGSGSHPATEDQPRRAPDPKETSPRRSHPRIPDRRLTVSRCYKRRAGHLHDRLFEPNTIEISSGNRKIYRLSLRGNRRVNHAIHMAAITQIRHSHSDGRARYDKKSPKERLIRRRSGPSSAGSATPSTRASAPTPRQDADNVQAGPGGQPGNDSDSSAAGSHPGHRLFGQATPEPSPTLQAGTPAMRTVSLKPASKKRPPESLTTQAKRDRSGAGHSRSR